jgi:palmitoyl-protein thioesterase
MSTVLLQNVYEKHLFVAFLFLVSFCLVFAQQRQPPVVLVHGILSSAEELVSAKQWFAENLDIEIFSIEIGDGRVDSITKPMREQLDALTYSINSFQRLREEQFHLIGFSQGGLLARAFAENSREKRVKTLMTFGTPHMGVFFYSDTKIYSEKAQSQLSFAGYWKDPFNYDLYLHNCSFLPYFNGEITTDVSLYNKVTTFVMVWSPLDEVIRPWQSGRYEFYYQNSITVVPFLSSETFRKNHVGIRSLYRENRLCFIETDCAHKDFKSRTCLDKYKEEILPFLKA